MDIVSDRSLRRDRLVIGTGLVAITVAAWAYMAYEALAMYETGSCQCAGMKMSGADIDPSSPATLFPLFLMWTEMMVAMMLPTAAPMILAYARMERERSPSQAPFLRTALFSCGYLLVWTGFSVFAAVAQYGLNVLGWLSPLMESNNRIFAGTLLVGAGLFQFVRLKNSCLERCRSRQSYLFSQWRPGRLGALALGWDHGLKCAGCCSFLMLLLFVGGVMNLWWIAMLTLFVLVEKAVPRIGNLSRAAGVCLTIWGVVTLVF